jgi:hypothetical protein
MSNEIYNKLKAYADANLNVLLIGKHGIGKTETVKAIANELGEKFGYYSTPTLDPWADIVGIPVPDKETKTLDFYKPTGIQSAEFLFFDELNRAHPRTLNAILEIIQFKSCNGTPLPKLKKVWAAINPPNENYQVEELDPALVDRFHVYIKMVPDFNMEYMKTKFEEKIAAAIRDWWNIDCDKEQRNLVTPRRLEYIGLMAQNGLPYTDAMPPGHTFPEHELKNRIEVALGNKTGKFFLTKDFILNNKDLVMKEILDNPPVTSKLPQLFISFNEQQLFECRDILEMMPKELVMNIGKPKLKIKKVELHEVFKKNGVDISDYKKISEAWKL